MENRFGKLTRRLAAAFAVAGMGLAGNASAVLLNRDIGADKMVYDTVLDITWTRQAGDGVLRDWAPANAWAAALVFGGFDDWRLPYASVAAGAGPTEAVHSCTGTGGADEIACRSNEMGYMYYYNLPGAAGSNKTGTQTAVGGEVLTGIQPAYWSGTEFGSGDAWGFDFGVGSLFVGAPLRGGLFAWAVRSGDVPEPASWLLMGLGALGLAWSRRPGRRR